MINGGQNIKVHKLMDSLLYFDIEYIDNARKILKMNDIEYQSFMELQYDDDIESMVKYNNKYKYVLDLLCEKYITEEGISFIKGFRMISTKLVFSKYINLINFVKYISGNNKYNILDKSNYSLKNNLEIIIDHHDIVHTNERENERNKYKSDEIDKFKIIIKDNFCDLLSEINEKDPNKMKSFIKFWFGTHSINNFELFKPKLNLTYDNNGRGCFISSTCFATLYINKYLILDFINNVTLMKNKFNQIIDMSLKNQELMEKAGFFMQLA
jgi:hypothetical protein